MTEAWVAYEWAVIRVVPQVHLERFENVGVIVHARTAALLEARADPDWERLHAVFPALDRGLVERHLDGYLRTCRGESDAGPVALLPPSERFHWLTAPRSGVIQTSEVRPGRSRDLRSTLDCLFDEQCR